MGICRAFAAGAAFPALLMPFILMSMAASGFETASALSFFHFLPLCWGAWNIFYIYILRNILSNEKKPRLTFAGAFLGLLVASYAIFIADIPSALGIKGVLKFTPLFLAPLIYGFFWCTAVNFFNSSVGIHDN